MKCNIIANVDATRATGATHATSIIFRKTAPPNFVNMFTIFGAPSISLVAP